MSRCRHEPIVDRASRASRASHAKPLTTRPFVQGLQITYVTTLIAAGVDIRTVAERHGHAQATMTLNRYAHALPERDRHAATVLGDTFTSTRRSPTSARPRLGAGAKSR